jgi:nitroreductase
MELSDLADLIKSRRSIRIWQNKEVPEELLLKAIELATWAPNAGNQQNWHFYLIENRDTIEAMANVVQSSANLIASWPEAEQMGDMAKSRLERVSLFRHAPAIIVVTTPQYQSQIDEILALREKTDPEAVKMRQWRNTADSRIQSASSAIAYLLLILHQMGLGAVWMTGPMQAKGEIEKVLQIPHDMDAIALIPVGYPAETPAPKERKPVLEVCEVVR